MPQRAANILIALAGAAAVVALILVGLDAARAARTGPAWKRRLIAAGLALLAALGAPGCGDEAPQRSDAEIIASIKDKPLAETEPWKQLSTAWAEGEAIAAGERGNYPFDEKGKQRVLESLATAKHNADLLDRGGLLTVTEATLLAKGLNDLAGRVSGFRTTAEMGATCYEPMPMTAARDGFARLTDRLPLLEWLAEEGIVTPGVVEKILATVEKDIAALGDENELRAVPEDRRDAARLLGGKAAACVARLRAKLAKPATQPTTGAGEGL